MVKIPNEIKEKINQYISNLNENNFKLKKVILFGSYINGKYSAWSDIDVALISDEFTGDRFEDRKRIARITLDVDYRIDPLPFNTKDFDYTNLFVKEIIDTGLVIYSN